MDEFVKAFSALSDDITAKIDAKIDDCFSKLKQMVEAMPSMKPAPKEVTGNEALAAELNVSVGTVSRWKRFGILDNAIVSEYGRTIIYDVRKAKECLKIQKVKPGRPAQKY